MMLAKNVQMFIEMFFFIIYYYGLFIKIIFITISILVTISTKYFSFEENAP